MEASAQEVAHRAALAWVDVTLGQDAQAQQMRQVARIGLVAAVLESGVLRHGRSIGQMYRVAVLFQAIDQPIPVVRRLHNDARHLVMVRLQFLEDRRQFIGQPALPEWAVVLVEHGQDAIAGMQIDRCVK